MLRSSNGLWFIGTVLPGDSGGVAYDPLNGEALGVNSMTVYGLIGRAQPVDVAVEKAYDVPDGQVNEYFALPESTEEHTPMRSYEEDQNAIQSWAQETVAQELATPEEVMEVAQGNTEAAVGEINALVETSTEQVLENPADWEPIFQNTAETVDTLGTLAEDTASAAIEAGLGLALQERS